MLEVKETTMIKPQGKRPQRRPIFYHQNYHKQMLPIKNTSKPRIKKQKNTSAI